MGRILLPRIVVRPLVRDPHMTVRIQPQHMHWQVGRYKELLRSGPGGLGRGRIWVPEAEGEQHNMILDNFYDNLIPSSGILGPSRYAAVGTGSVAPDPTQTILQNEVARSDLLPSGEVNGAIYISPGVYDIKRVVEFTEAQVGNRNLTEWGFSPSSTSGGSLMTRELFRDANGNPVVITPASDQRLRLIYKYRVTLGPTTPQAVTVNINGLGLRTAKFVVVRGANCSSSVSIAGIHFGGTSPFGDLLVAQAAATASTELWLALTSQAAPLTYSQGSYIAGVSNVGVTYDPPVGRSRRWRRLFGTDAANITIVSAILSFCNFGRIDAFATVNLVFDTGQEFTKTNLYKLLVGDWTLTWGP